MENKDLRDSVKEMLAETDAGFTDWEIEFLDNMMDWQGDYTDRQAAKIQSIYEERM